MTTAVELLPVRPHRAGARRRRRHLKQLPYRLHQIAPGAATILVTSVLWKDEGESELHFHLVVRDADGQQVPMPRDETTDVVTALQKAFPSADWTRAQTWHWRGNRLSQWRPVLPAELRGMV